MPEVGETRTRVKDFGMDRMLATKIHGRYDPRVEAEVLGFIKSNTGENVEAGSETFYRGLRDGKILLKLAQKIREGTPNCPEAVQNMDLNINEQEIAFKQMENIEKFLKFCRAYGVSKVSCFPTVDLFEARNLPNVFATLQLLGSECQRNGFSGSPCGPKPTEKHQTNFTEETLRAGHGLIGLQYGTNKLASQKGMTSMGAVRHIADIRVKPVNDPQTLTFVSLQYGSNQFDSQKGMTGFGSIRHVSDMKVDKQDQNSQGELWLQTGTNKFDSQKGMTAMGAIRHVSDMTKNQPDQDKEGANVISTQMGTNQYASQKGMAAMGGIRHVSDMKVEEASEEGKATINLQCGTNKFDSQKGMTMFGTPRPVKEVNLLDPDQEAMSAPSLQLGTNKYDSQKGMTAIGANRWIMKQGMPTQDQRSQGVTSLQYEEKTDEENKGIVFGRYRHI